MKSALVSLVLLSMACAPGAMGGTQLLYNNTTTDTGDTVFFSIGPYISLGDQIHLLSAGTANQAQVEMFNLGGPGSFDAVLDLFTVGSPVGTSLGSFDYPTDIISTGGDVLDLTFDLGSLTVPQDLIFTISISNVSAGMDLGVDMFEPPTVGTSDPSFMIAATTGPTYSQLGTANEDVYFQLSGTPVSLAPESSSLTLLGAGLLLVIGFRTQKRRLSER